MLSELGQENLLSGPRDLTPLVLGRCVANAPVSLKDILRSSLEKKKRERQADSRSSSLDQKKKIESKHASLEQKRKIDSNASSLDRGKEKLSPKLVQKCKPVSRESSFRKQRPMGIHEEQLEVLKSFGSCERRRKIGWLGKPLVPPKPKALCLDGHESEESDGIQTPVSVKEICFTPISTKETFLGPSGPHPGPSTER